MIRTDHLMSRRVFLNLESTPGSAMMTLLFRERAGVAIVAGEVLVDRVDVEKAVAFRVQLFELLTAALRQDDMAGVAIACLDLRLAVRRFVKAVVAAKTAGPFFVAEIVWVGA